jgi:hypothetical protein
MYYTDKYLNLNDAQFLRVTGLKKHQFNLLLGLLTDYIKRNWSTRGRQDSKLTVTNTYQTQAYLTKIQSFIDSPSKKNRKTQLTVKNE